MVLIDLLSKLIDFPNLLCIIIEWIIRFLQLLNDSLVNSLLPLSVTESFQ